MFTRLKLGFNKTLLGNVLDLWNRRNRWERLSSGFPVVLDPICCPRCHTTDGVKHSKSAEGKQRYRCRNGEWEIDELRQKNSRLAELQSKLNEILHS
ncbi:hypothetical protein C7293_15190 [filamentous cyanobacterium CCT1]|nr:hypothetical protein C7293_15190 [filamentous cyanobacterium CCT1]PSN77587.1 hypothetical protein C8B47_21325 [filamentous cyanobacterium CCP4]